MTKLIGHVMPAGSTRQVQRKYSDFELLQETLLENHPELTLPALPKRNVWFINEDDLEDRRVSFDCLLKKLAK